MILRNYIIFDPTGRCHFSPNPPPPEFIKSSGMKLFEGITTVPVVGHLPDASINIGVLFGAPPPVDGENMSCEYVSDLLTRATAHLDEAKVLLDKVGSYTHQYPSDKPYWWKDKQKNQGEGIFDAEQAIDSARYAIEGHQERMAEWISGGKKLPGT